MCSIESLNNLCPLCTSFLIANQPIVLEFYILARLPMVRGVMVANILILVLGRLIYVVYDFISRQGIDYHLLPVFCITKALIGDHACLPDRLYIQWLARPASIASLISFEKIGEGQRPRQVLGCLIFLGLPQKFGFNKYCGFVYRNVHNFHQIPSLLGWTKRSFPFLPMILAENVKKFQGGGEIVKIPMF